VPAHYYCSCAQVSAKQVLDYGPDFVLRFCQESKLLKLAGVHSLKLGSVKGNQILRGGSPSQLPYWHHQSLTQKTAFVRQAA